MFSTGRFRRAFFLALMLAPAAAFGQAAADATLFRVFLRDGSTIVSYGEYARVADRVIVTVPLGETTAAPDLEVLSIPADTVDWDKTDAYADSARAARYAATLGPNDFAELNNAVTMALNDIAVTTDPARKIAMATEARQNVMKWVSEHYGYRAQDVAHLATLFDDVIVETRRANGEPDFDMALVANLAAPPDAVLMTRPSAEETVELAMRAVAIAPDATERTSLLTAIERTLTSAGPGAAWAVPVRARVTAALDAEQRTDHAYSVLTQNSLKSADRYAAVGDVTAVERVVRSLLRQDDRLGQRRPQEVAAALATLDAKLDAARSERLARDHRAARAEALADYRRAIEEPMATMRREKPALDDIRRLAGPSRTRLTALSKALALAERSLDKVTVPEEVTPAHSLLKNALQLASRAAAGRQQAVLTSNMQTAQEASSAAAGAIMLFDKASDDLKHLLQ